MHSKTCHLHHLVYFSSIHSKVVESKNHLRYHSHLQTQLLPPLHRSKITQLVVLMLLGEITEIISLHDEGKIHNLREAILFDATDSIPISIWNTLIDEIDEGKWYSFTNLSLRYYFVLKLSTTKRTTSLAIDNAQPVPDISNGIVLQYDSLSNNIHSKLNQSICCPEITSVNIEHFHSCLNCQQRIALIPSRRIVTCQNCGNAMRCDKVVEKVDCILLLNGHEKSLILPLDVLSRFIKKETSCILEDTEALKETILFMDDVDFTINTKGMITEIKKHSS